MTALQRDPGILVTDLGDELVLLDPRTRRMFTLNETGRIVWKHLDGGSDAAVAALVDSFSVGREQARRDVDELLCALQVAGMVRPG